jgi:hypothetical protein
VTLTIRRGSETLEATLPLEEANVWSVSEK